MLQVEISSRSNPMSISGLVVKSIVAIDGPRVRFAADAALHFCCPSVREQEFQETACNLADIVHMSVTT
ncbi:hypothetical protein F4814DRAFT_362405 [Daldinia grandis]|nr:hypothetical protein F4814DRAFT_362405 [Daldinia grandis]